MSSPSTAKLRPYDDPRVSLRSIYLNGRSYGYIYHPRHPNTPNRGTIVLIHGFPDLAFGWRYQIPFLASLGLDVIAPDCIGYGRTDSPEHGLGDFTFKRIADDVAALSAQLNLGRILLGGHDWGGAVVYRIALYHPQLIRALFVLCTAYTPPQPVYVPLYQLVATRLPEFGYQVVLASGAVETNCSTPATIRQFLAGTFGARNAAGEHAFTPTAGPDFVKQASITGPPSRIFSPEEFEFYVKEYSRNGLRGPLNWYRTRENNFVDEYLHFFDTDRSATGGTNPKPKVSVSIQQETLYIGATKDWVLKPWMAAKMGKFVPRLTRAEVEASHWAAWERADEVNAIIADWLTKKVFINEDDEKNNEAASKAKARL
ncbi:hypothetical protein DV738_g1314, partial [Chaetothyriales sp. CBS 135597]